MHLRLIAQKQNQFQKYNTPADFKESNRTKLNNEHNSIPSEQMHRYTIAKEDP